MPKTTMPSNPQPSWFKTVEDLLQGVIRQDTRVIDIWVPKVQKILGGAVPVHAELFCAAELYYGVPAIIARLRTLRAMDMS